MPCILLQNIVVIIGVNTRLLIQGKLEGIGYFQEQLLMRLARNHPKDTFVFFFDRKYDKSFIFSDNIIPVVLPLQARHPILWKIYFDYLLSIYCKKYHIDVFFSPENYIPQIKNIPIICTIHDLNFYHNDKYIGNNLHQKYFMHYFPMNAHKSDRIITVSEYSKKDIIESFHIEENKIDVVYNAANRVYTQQNEQKKELTRIKYTGGKPYFYFVGSLHKRKNLVNLFLAFDMFKNKTKSDVQLLIIGGKKWWKGEIENTYNALIHKQDVLLLGRKEAKEVAEIASASIGLVFVSLFEGFGIPIVEAFAAGVPVITSNVTSLPEIAGDAALIVNPYNIESISEAMQKLYEDKDLRNTLIEKGFNRNKMFSWDKSAEKLWKIIESTAK